MADSYTRATLGASCYELTKGEGLAVHVLKNIIKNIKTSNFLSFFFKSLVYWVVRLLISTYRLRITIAPSLQVPLQKNKGVFYFWHQQIIAGMTFFFKLGMRGSCVVSPSNDGKFAGYICDRLGFTVLYGSSYKSSVQLVRQSLMALRDTGQLCVVGDGSRGPAFQLQQGLLYLANKSDVPLIFVECSSSWFWSFKKSWDKFQIPLPFSKIFIHVHVPVMVSADDVKNNRNA